MRIQVTGKQIEIGAPLKQRIEQRLNDGVAKYFGSGIDAHVGFQPDAARVRAECSVHIGRGIHVQAHALADDAAHCFEAACDRLEKQLRRYKRRLRDHHDKARAGPAPDDMPEQAPSYVIAPEPEDAAEPEGEFQPVVVAESTTDIHRLTVGEAVMRLDLSEAPVVVFRNAGNGRPNLVYRRSDGHIGWIDLPGTGTTGEA
ncbi:MAG: ribosome-associated translation inhibitor RaiA [Alphaproteobacteria bacterium]